MFVAIALAVFVAAHLRGEPETNTRALTFTTFVIANLASDIGESLVDTADHWNSAFAKSALWWVISGALGVLAIVIYAPFARDLFRFSRLHTIDLLICGVAGLLNVLWLRR